MDGGVGGWEGDVKGRGVSPGTGVAAGVGCGVGDACEPVCTQVSHKALAEILHISEIQQPETLSADSC